MANIHPTAIVDSGARIAADVQIGPGCVIEADVTIGPACVLREYVVIRKYTTLGRGNTVDAFTVFGGQPQDYKFNPDTVSYVRIGDNNVFREGVTISRATGDGNETVVGNETFWMTGAHAGHNAVIEDDAVLTNGCAIGGHATIGRCAILSGHVQVHQFTWVGEMTMTQGHAGLSMHLPPYTMLAGINRVIGLNSVGLRRAADITDEDRRQIKEAFKLLYRCGLPVAKALAEMDAHTDWGTPAGKFRDFCRRAIDAAPPYNRGLCQLRARLSRR